MQKLLFVFITTLVFITSTFAQKKQKNTDNEERQIYVSALLNIDSEEINNTQRFARLQSNSTDSIITLSTNKLPRNISNFGFTFQSVNANNKYQEISLARLRHVKEEHESTNIRFFSGTPDVEIFSGSTISLWDIKTRYEFGKYLLPKNSKINFGIGLAAAPGFYSYTITPRISSVFPQFRWNANVDMTLVPVATFKLTDNLSIAAKVIPSLINIEWKKDKIDNPILTERQRVNTTFDASFFDKSTVTNIQLRFKIGSSKVQENTKSKRKGKKKRLKRRRR